MLSQKHEEEYQGLGPIFILGGGLSRGDSIYEKLPGEKKSRDGRQNAGKKLSKN